MSGGWRRADVALRGHACHAMPVPWRGHARLWSCQQPWETFEGDAISQLAGDGGNDWTPERQKTWKCVICSLLELVNRVPPGPAPGSGLVQHWTRPGAGTQRKQRPVLQGLSGVSGGPRGWWAAGSQNEPLIYGGRPHVQPSSVAGNAATCETNWRLRFVMKTHCCIAKT